jgi:anti-anti-sigma factor
MTRQFRLIHVERKNDVFCVHLRQRKLDETDIYALADEMLHLINVEGCRKMVLCLGPEEPQCLYSVFLAKLISVRRQILEKGGALKLCDAGSAVTDVFAACQLQDYFDFAPDEETAIEQFTSNQESGIRN